MVTLKNSGLSGMMLLAESDYQKKKARHKAEMQKRRQQQAKEGLKINKPQTPTKKQSGAGVSKFSNSAFKPKSLQDLLRPTPNTGKLVTINGGELPEVSVVAKKRIPVKGSTKTNTQTSIQGAGASKPVVNRPKAPVYTGDEKSIMKMSADDIKALQELVGTKADGIWGPKSHAAYLAYKKKNKGVKNLQSMMETSNLRPKKTMRLDIDTPNPMNVDVSPTLDNFDLSKVKLF